ncbi:MAG: DUF1684 domain-containing protein [Actinomycetota bacterium]
MSDGHDAFVLSWHRWRRQREATLAHRHGFLAITSINWLGTAPQRFDDAPGEWWADAEGAHVALVDGEELIIDGRPASGEHHIGVIAEDNDVMLPWGEAIIEVARRGGDYIVRPRHPDAPILASYPGTPAYAPTHRWVVHARFEPFAEPRTVAGASVVDGLTLQHHSPGVARFEVDGSPHSLLLFADPPETATETATETGGEPSGDMWAFITDGTSGITTSSSCRMIMVSAPAADGSVVIDFNRARNLPCAYTPLATCPLPPPENRLRIPIEAGEMVPQARNRAT